MTTRKYKSKPRKKSSIKNKKIQSIQIGGTKTDVKLAILFITTHGNIDPSEAEIINDTGINVRKINAISPGVCNYIEDDELLEMGKKLNKFIADRIKNKTGLTHGELTSHDSLEFQFNSIATAQQYINNFSKAMRSYIPKIDGVLKETVKTYYF